MVVVVIVIIIVIGRFNVATKSLVIGSLTVAYENMTCGIKFHLQLMKKLIVFQRVSKIPFCCPIQNNYTITML